MRAGSWCTPRTRRRPRSTRWRASGAGVVLCPSTEAQPRRRPGRPARLARCRRAAVDRLRQPGDARLARGAALARLRPAPARCASATSRPRREPACRRPPRGCSTRALAGGAAAAGEPALGAGGGRARRRAGGRHARPRLLGIPPQHLLDALVFSSPGRPWRDVMVGGAMGGARAPASGRRRDRPRFEAAMREIW